MNAVTYFDFRSNAARVVLDEKGVSSFGPIPTNGSKHEKHFNVKRDCEVMFAELELDMRKFAHIYLDSMNRQQTEYLLPPIQISIKPCNLELTVQMEEQPKAKRNFALCFKNNCLFTNGYPKFFTYPLKVLLNFEGIYLVSLSNISSLILALRKFRSYSNFALSKISRLVLADYINKGVHSPHRAFFVRNISMHSHVMAKLERDIFICAGFLYCLSANPFQLCHLNYLAVTGKAPLNKGAH